ncbi:hypothetical protein [Streptomyces sp. ODS28]|uniref:hypothetical protein n=1 Tax=Streptomyces sp. ODS28 TaxID=3136688 RepID=UPI0031EE1EC9
MARNRGSFHSPYARFTTTSGTTTRIHVVSMVRAFRVSVTAARRVLRPGLCGSSCATASAISTRATSVG